MLGHKGNDWYYNLNKCFESNLERLLVGQTVLQANICFDSHIRLATYSIIKIYTEITGVGFIIKVVQAAKLETAHEPLMLPKVHG
jgi:hypothetical protein